MSQPNTPDGNTHEHGFLKPSNPMSGRRQQTTADFRPPRLEHQSTSTSSSIGRYATQRPSQNETSRPLPDRNNSAPGRPQPDRLSTAATTCYRFQTANDGTLPDSHYRGEKKQEQTVDVDNDYTALNPWYNQQKDKPVFGLASPYPRTVRKGMRRGRGDLRKARHQQEEQDFSNDQAEEDEERIIRDDASTVPKDFYGDSEDVQGPIDESDDTKAPQLEHLETGTTGTGSHRVGSRRLSSSEADQELHHRGFDHDSSERAPINEHGLTYSDQKYPPQRNHFGLQDGLPPLQELDSKGTSQTQKEKHEIHEREQEAVQEYYNQYRNPIARLRAQYPQAPAEFLCTFVYLFLGITANLSVATSRESTGNFETQAWAWGFATMAGIYLGGGVSGAHLSPVISLTLSLYRGFPWKMCCIYILMQLLAGLCAGSLAWAIYRDAILDVDPRLTADITGKALYPIGPKFKFSTGFFNDFVCMAIYVCIAFALGDDQNSPPGQGMSAVVFGFTAFVITVCLGYNTGLGISPARDLGPRLVALWVGYPNPFADGWWAVGPWGASLSGGLVGGFMYDLLIFVGGESPVNYRWPQPQEIKENIRSRRKQAKDKIQRIV